MNIRRFRILVLLLTALLCASSIALASPPPPETTRSIGALASDLCRTPCGTGQELCTFIADPAHQSDGDCNDPTSSCYLSFFLRNGMKDPTTKIDALVAACDPNAGDLEAASKQSKNVAAEQLILSAVGGFQSFLEDRAKEEAMTFAVNRFKDTVCEAKSPVASYFVQTCALLGDDLSFDEATLVRLKKALLVDLNHLPSTFVGMLPPSKNADEIALRIFGQSGAESGLAVAQSEIGLTDIPSTWAEKDRTLFAGATSKVACSLAGSNKMSPGCWSLLLPELGSAAVAIQPPPTTEGIAKVIDTAAKSFCTTYGAPNEQNDGECLLGTNGNSLLANAATKVLGLNAQQAQAATILKANLKNLVIASLRFAEIARKAKVLAGLGTPSTEITTRLLPDVASALNAWNSALQAALPGLKPNTKKALDGAVFALDASAAVASRNYSDLVAAISKALEPGQPLATLKLSPKVSRSLGFAARLASAQKPEDAKKVIEEEAAPLGSYKVKYDRDGWTIAINSFVGTFIGTGVRFKQLDSDGKGIDSEWDFVARPLSAPVGLDFTFPFPECKYLHAGAIITAIDPFAMGTIDEDANAEEFDWGAMLTPGLLLRLGVGGSPFTFIGGFTGQPLARSQDTCPSSGDKPCWKGAFQVTGGIAIDVPLLILH